MATIETAYYVPTFLGLSTTLGISCAVSTTCIIAFEVCRRSDSMKCLFSPRAQLEKDPIPRLSNHLFSWVTSTFHLDEAAYAKQVGLDATMHIRYLRMAVHFLVFLALLICPVLLTLHWTGSPSSLNKENLASEFTSLAKNESSEIHASSASSLSSFYGGLQQLQQTQTNETLDHFRSNSTLYYLSIANVPNNSPVLWVHVLFSYVMSLVWLWLLFANHMHHLDLLQQQQQQQQLPETQQSEEDDHSNARLHERSVLITHVPHHLRNQVMLQQYMEHGQVGEVECVTLIWSAVISALEVILKKREKTVDRLETVLIAMVRKAQTMHAFAAEEQEMYSVLWYDWLSHIKDHHVELGLTDQVVMIKSLLKDIQEMDEEINRLRDVNRAPEYYMPTGAAFVTFKSAYSAQICAQIVTSWKPGIFDVRMAPEPRDVLWRSLLRRGRKSRVAGILKQWIVQAVIWSLTIFWLFPITFILGLTSLQSLSQHLIFLRYFLTSSFVIRSFVQNILPTLLVTLFMSLLPWIVLEISKRQDFVSYSELENSVFGRYYHFAIFNVLIVFLLGTTFLTTMLDVLYEPTMLLQLLANALPQGANFFLNYILFNSSTHAMELIQLGSQLFGHLVLTQPCISRTPRMRMRYTSPWSFPFYYYYPSHILVLVITLTYSVIQPLILIFALFYFSFALAVYRHQYMYCYIRRYETNGSRHYRRIVRYTSDGLIIFQLTMIGLLYLKGVLSAATTVLPLLIFTIWTKVKLHRLFQQRIKHPYIGGFTGVFASRLNYTPTSNSFIWNYVDNIWKFSYIIAWCTSGRYAQQRPPSQSSPQQQHRSERAGQESVKPQPNTSANSTMVVDPIKVTNYNKEDGTSNRRISTTIQIDQKEDAFQRYHDFTVYADDTTSTFETYEHPALSTPLVTDLILPLNPRLKYWDMKSCVYVSLDTVQSIFH